MPETYTPVTWADGPAGGTPVTAAQLNRIETGLESMDDRGAALELSILTPQVITYAASLSLDASTGSLFRITATGALAITAITNGTNGQQVTIQITASGADRVVTWSVGSVPTATIASGTTATWTLRYYSASSAWTIVSASTTTVVSGEGATYVGTKTITGMFGVNVTPVTKQPVNMIVTIPGSSTGAQDKVGFALLANATGNFAGQSGSNPGFFWGMNVFATTGSAAGDGAGLTDIIGGLIEMSIQTPSGTTLPHVIGLQAEAAFFGATSGCTVTQMESMRVSAPKRKDGASTGTATNVYGLFVEDVTAYNVAATNQWSLFVEGGISRLQGRVDVSNIITSYNNSLSLQGSTSGAGKISLTTTSIGFFGVTPVARQTLPASGSVTAADIRTALINLGLCQ